jgi:hypothetical protein
LIWTNNPNNPNVKAIVIDSTGKKAGKDIGMEIETIDSSHSEGIALCGDIFFKLINAKNDKLICRFAINTAFIKENKYEFRKETVDPDSVRKSKKFSNDFSITLHFSDTCHLCDSGTPLDKLCEKCLNLMKNKFKVYNEWREIHEILENHEGEFSMLEKKCFNS